MTEIETLLATINELIESHSPSDGITLTKNKELCLFRESTAQNSEHSIYEPAIIFATQGTKLIHLHGQHFKYSAGTLFALFMPMAFEYEVIDVSHEKPLLGVGIRLDRHKLSRILTKMDTVEPLQKTVDDSIVSGVFTAPINVQMLDAINRLLRSLDNPNDCAILGDALIQEIYYRVLSLENQGPLRQMLRKHGEMQHIALAVEHLHNNLKTNVSVEELAALVNMSTSGFHKKFKIIMHMSPLQYIKSIRLNMARTYILEGAKSSEAGYRVGYNSPAQFSREYKRKFGIAPSDS